MSLFSYYRLKTCLFLVVSFELRTLNRIVLLVYTTPKMMINVTPLNLLNLAQLALISKLLINKSLSNMQSRQTKVDDINRTLGTYTKLNPFDNGSPSKITSNHIHPNRL